MTSKPSKPFDIITIGGGVRDVFLKSKEIKLIKSPKFVTGVGECVPLGSKLDVDEIVITTGGGATNAAVTFSRLGFKTACACRLGNDRVGDDVIFDLESEGVDAQFVRRAKGEMTGYSTLLTAASGERSILVYRGASKKFTPADLPLKKCTTKWYYLTSLGGNLDLSKKVIRHAAKCKSKIAWNPGGGEIAKGLKNFKSVLKDVSILNINREEAQKLTKKKDLGQMFKILATEGNIVIITDGNKGAYTHLDGKTFYSKTTGAKSVSRAGAGDAFGSGFVSSIMKGKSLEEALAIGTLNAEGVIGSLGAKQGILKNWPAKKNLARVKTSRKRI